jgi:hypothetical protein
LSAACFEGIQRDERKESFCAFLQVSEAKSRLSRSWTMSPTRKVWLEIVKKTAKRSDTTKPRCCHGPSPRRKTRRIFTYDVRTSLVSEVRNEIPGSQSYDTLPYQNQRGSRHLQIIIFTATTMRQKASIHQ